MTRLLTIMMLALTAGSVMAQGTVYKTTDEQGNVVYTDQPSDSAQEVPVQAPQTFPARDLAKEYGKFKPAEKNGPVDTTPPYEVLAVTYPINDEAIRSNPGNIEITFNIVPRLQPGHRLELHMDGQMLQELHGGKPVALENVDRGTHTVQLKVINTPTKSEVQSSDPVSFTVLRVSKVGKKSGK